MEIARSPQQNTRPHRRPGPQPARTARAADQPPAWSGPEPSWRCSVVTTADRHRRPPSPAGQAPRQATAGRGGGDKARPPACSSPARSRSSDPETATTPTRSTPPAGPATTAAVAPACPSWQSPDPPTPAGTPWSTPPPTPGGATSAPARPSPTRHALQPRSSRETITKPRIHIACRRLTQGHCHHYRWSTRSLIQFVSMRIGNAHARGAPILELITRISACGTSLSVAVDRASVRNADCKSVGSAQAHRRVGLSENLRVTRGTRSVTALRPSTRRFGPDPRMITVVSPCSQFHAQPYGARPHRNCSMAWQERL